MFAKKDKEGYDVVIRSLKKAGYLAKSSNEGARQVAKNKGQGKPENDKKSMTTGRPYNNTVTHTKPFLKPYEEKVFLDRIDDSVITAVKNATIRGVGTSIEAKIKVAVGSDPIRVSLRSGRFDADSNTNGIKDLLFDGSGNNYVVALPGQESTFKVNSADLDGVQDLSIYTQSHTNPGGGNNKFTGHLIIKSKILVGSNQIRLNVRIKK
ncbi:hypothetical protein [Microscilla marina]|uniref:Uncharacterized protein n=1 Tax=Microscilla marina ATCC 23134 TaxID=313606 RepID=A1ZV78_MICM2|nr:hypothetical protein [Microscilla marina]EAY25734.1 hypothetical protein M23134_04908 [Microscilla marina ATCC 23134]